MLKRTQSPKKLEKDWFSFSVPLAMIVGGDYLALRLLYRLEPESTAFAMLGKMMDVAEKSLKLFVVVMQKSPAALTDVKGGFGHNVERLRSVAASFNPAFDEADVLSLSRSLNDNSGKLYQQIRYGSEETTEGFSAEPALLMPVIDKIFYQSFAGMPPGDRRMMFCASPIKALIQRLGHDQTRNPELLSAALKHSNTYFDRLVELCVQIDSEEMEIRAAYERMVARTAV